MKALARNETVTVFYRGKPGAEMRAISGGHRPAVRAKDHPASGMWPIART